MRSLVEPFKIPDTSYQLNDHTRFMVGKAFRGLGAAQNGMFLPAQQKNAEFAHHCDFFKQNFQLEAGILTLDSAGPINSVAKTSTTQPPQFGLTLDVSCVLSFTPIADKNNANRHSDCKTNATKFQTS